MEEQTYPVSHRQLVHSDCDSYPLRGNQWGDGYEAILRCSGHRATLLRQRFCADRHINVPQPRAPISL